MTDGQFLFAALHPVMTYCSERRWLVNSAGGATHLSSRGHRFGSRFGLFIFQAKSQLLKLTSRTTSRLLSNRLLLELIKNARGKDKGNQAPWRVWISHETRLVFVSLISASKEFPLRSHIRHSIHVYHHKSNTSNFAKKPPLCVVFSTHFSVFSMWWNTVFRVWYITSALRPSNRLTCCFV